MVSGFGGFLRPTVGMNGRPASPIGRRIAALLWSCSHRRTMAAATVALLAGASAGGAAGTRVEVFAAQAVVVAFEAEDL